MCPSSLSKTERALVQALVTAASAAGAEAFEEDLTRRVTHLIAQPGSKSVKVSC